METRSYRNTKDSEIIDLVSMSLAGAAWSEDFEAFTTEDKELIKNSSSIDVEIIMNGDEVIDARIFDPFRQLNYSKSLYLNPSGWSHYLITDLSEGSYDDLV